MSQVLKAAQSTGHGYLFFSSSFRIPWLYPPYTPSGVEGASKCCSSSGGEAYQAVKPEVSLEAFVAISMAVFPVVSPMV